jgi:dihydropyrimidinase
LIKGGRVVTAQKDVIEDLLIEDDKITRTGNLGDYPAEQVIDASGKLVIPGGIDPHTHFDLPSMGTVGVDDFFTGTAAAAVGGTTTIIDFPTQNRGEDPRVSLEEWFGRSEGKTAVDWAFHQIITDLSGPYLSSLQALMEEGVSSFKLFMAYPDALMLDDGSILRALQWTRDHGGLVMLHCENGPAIEVLVQQALAGRQTEPIYHALTRPSTVEGEATSRAIALAQVAQVPVYVVHLSARESLQAVRGARQRGLPVYAETCPHYLLLSDDDLRSPGFQGAKYVCSPPLRPASHQEPLWQGLASGDLQLVSTDHAPFNFSGQKEMGRNDFSKIPNGMPGVEWRMNLLYHFGVGQGRFSLNRWVEITSTNAAKLFGLYPQKGEIAPGSDADLVIFDPDHEHTLTAENQMTSCDYNPYEGLTLRGAPERVLLRGGTVVEDGKFVGRAGMGRFIKRRPEETLQDNILS